MFVVNCEYCVRNYDLLCLFMDFVFSINDNIFLCHAFVTVKQLDIKTCVRSVLQVPALSSGRQLATSDAIDQLHESGTTSK